MILKLASKENTPALPRQLAKLAPRLPARFLTSPRAAKGFSSPA